MMRVVKRDGKIVDFDESRIKIAIGKANNEVDESQRATEEEIEKIVEYVKKVKKDRILVEDIQDIIERYNRE